ncbi:MAG: hypothetical protein CJBNEKGG_02825 [Prosthecobacter sp.]|nr:hypothetical protein [Prosthecobacter sp.]
MKFSSCLLMPFMATALFAQDVPPVTGSGPDSPPEATAGTPSDSPQPEASPESAAAQPGAPGVPSHEEDEAAIPAAFELSRYQASWEKNPFLLKTAPISQPTANWGQDWALAGMFSYNGKIRISIRNKQTNEMKRVSNEVKEGDEFRLVRANFSKSRRDASAVIAKGGQEAELKYDENAAPVTINNTVRPGGGAAPGNAPGVPPVPGGVPINKPSTAVSGGRVFNSPVLPGGVAATPGSAPMAAPQTGIINNAQVPGAASPPSISRRRQLIPAPVVPPNNP